MEDLLVRIIADAIDETFWEPESPIVEQYTEENNNEQLDCDNFKVCYISSEEVLVIIGNKKYIITVKEK